MYKPSTSHGSDQARQYDTSVDAEQKPKAVRAAVKSRVAVGDEVSSREFAVCTYSYYFI